jgi:membrane protein required for colicin V production
VTLDAAVLALLALAAVAGALAGAMRQVVLAAGAVAGWISVRLWAAAGGRLLERALSPPLARAVAAGLVFAIAFSAVGLAGRLVRRRSTGAGSRADRALGALLGGGEAALVAWVAIAVLDLAGPALPRALQAQLARSDLAALVREHDALGRLRRPAEQALQTLLQLGGDPRAAARLAADPELGGLLEDRRIQELLSGVGAAPRGAEAGRTPEALRLLADPEFRERLERAQGRLDAERARR